MKTWFANVKEVGFWRWFGNRKVDIFLLCACGFIGYVALLFFLSLIPATIVDCRELGTNAEHKMEVWVRTADGREYVVENDWSVFDAQTGLQVEYMREDQVRAGWRRKKAEIEGKRRKERWGVGE